VQQGAGAPSAAERALAEALAAGGVDVDFARGALSIEAAVLIKGEPARVPARRSGRGRARVALP
jgi:hypothetical protein